MAAEPRKNVAVLFGGRSVEHEISVITALQLMRVLDVTRYHAVPVYIAPTGHWYTGEALFDKSVYRRFSPSLPGIQEVRFSPAPDTTGLEVLPGSAFGRLQQLTRKLPQHLPIDIYILAFHGEFGEDGAIQGMMELADACYVGCNVAASALAMNKYLCKSVLHDHDIPVLPGVLVEKFDALADIGAVRSRILQTPGFEKFPLFVKPCHLGSSVGISKATDEASLDAGLMKVFRHDLQALIEPFVASMFEINVSVMDGDPPTASVVEIHVSDSGILSYEEKYMRDGGKKGTGASEGMASLTRSIDPATLDPDIKEFVRSTALKAYKILDCSGVVRFDFMHDNTDGTIYFNELNPIPGSFSFYLWEKSHPPLLYTEEINHLIERAVVRKQRRASLERIIGFKALQ